MSFLVVVVGSLAVIGGLGTYVVGKVIAHLVSEEVEGRINQLGYALLRLACKRLPKDLREVHYEFWAADLDEYYQNAEHRPLTRLFWSLRFPLPLLFKARTIARIMNPKSFVAKESIFKKITGSLSESLRIAIPAALAASGLVSATIEFGPGMPRWLQLTLVVSFGGLLIAEMSRQITQRTYRWLKGNSIGH